MPINNTPPKTKTVSHFSSLPLTHRHMLFHVKFHFCLQQSERTKYESVERAVQIQANEGRTDTFLEIEEEFYK